MPTQAILTTQGKGVCKICCYTGSTWSLTVKRHTYSWQAPASDSLSQEHKVLKEASLLTCVLQAPEDEYQSNYQGQTCGSMSHW